LWFAIITGGWIMTEGKIAVPSTIKDKPGTSEGSGTSGEEPSAGKDSSWLRVGRDETIKWGVTSVLGLAAIVAVWLWGWFAAGGPARALGAVPLGAVVAFTKPCDTQNGWQDYTHGSGRTIVGANPTGTSFVNLDERSQPLTRHELEKAGGAESFVLAKDDVPPQEVIAMVGTQQYNFLLNGAGKNADNTQALVGYSEKPVNGPLVFRTNGKGQEHKYMPPYIALYYCQKT
jgi:hypothetical protein